MARESWRGWQASSAPAVLDEQNQTLTCPCPRCLHAPLQLNSQTWDFDPDLGLRARDCPMQIPFTTNWLHVRRPFPALLPLELLSRDFQWSSCRKGLGASEVGGHSVPRKEATHRASEAGRLWFSQHARIPTSRHFWGAAAPGQNKFRALGLFTSKLEFRATLLQEAAVKYPSHAINIPRTSEATQAAQPWTTSCFWIPKHLSSSHLSSTRPSSSHPFSSRPSSTHPSSSHPSSTRKNCPEAAVRAEYLLDSRPLKLETKTPCQAFWARKLGIVPKPKNPRPEKPQAFKNRLPYGYTAARLSPTVEPDTRARPSTRAAHVS